MKLIVEASYGTVDEGKYIGELVEIKESNTVNGPALKFFFRILDAENEAIVSGMTSCKNLRTTTKLYEWLSVLNGGGNFAVGTELDPDEYIGTKVELLIENTEKEGKIYSNVKKLVRSVDRIPF